MNKPLALTQRQIKAICEGARKAGYAPILEIGKVRIHLVPEEHAILPQPETSVDREEEIEL